MNYKERIYRSLQYALAQTETNILDLIYEIKSYEDLVQTVTYMENVPHTGKHRNKTIFILHD